MNTISTIENEKPHFVYRSFDKDEDEDVTMTQKNILFICSKNRWRSPTAEYIAKKDYQLNAKSAGTSPKAKRKVSKTLLEWADIVLVMEGKHLDYLLQSFADIVAQKDIRVLDIPDVYPYMHPELIALLRYDLAFIKLSSVKSST